MASENCEKAIISSTETGRALLKFISSNDVGHTGSHQCGYYLPKSSWEIFAPFPPEGHTNKKHQVQIIWQNNLQTESVVTWYGGGTRSEYRLTRFGRNFPFLTNDCIGNLLVLIPKSIDLFHAYVLHLEEDIIEIQAALGTEVVGTWGIYNPTASSSFVSGKECVDLLFNDYSEGLSHFPSTKDLSKQTHIITQQCIDGFSDQISDKQLLNLVNYEYQLFRLVEQILCKSEVIRIFSNIDDFLTTAKSILNRRKSRAGKALENHVEYLLKNNSIEYEAQPKIDGKPDFIFPNREAYYDKSFPRDKLIMLGIKTTCKDRWRQVLNEAEQIPIKHLLTLQKGISNNQIAEMKKANLILVVPKSLHKEYPKESRQYLLSVDTFINNLKNVNY